MLSAPRQTRVFALAGAVILGGSASVFASDDIARTFPRVDFTVAADVPFVPGVPVAIPSTLIADAADVPAPAPLAEAAQSRPVDLVGPRGGDGISFDTGLRRSLYVSFAALQVMDLVSTRKALAAGGAEANPAMSGIVKNRAAFLAVKAGTAAATTFFAERISRKHPRAATIMMAVLNTAYAAIVAHNYRVASAR